MKRTEPIGDESWCDYNRHDYCTGMDENPTDPDTCDCKCHDDLWRWA